MSFGVHRALEGQVRHPPAHNLPTRDPRGVRLFAWSGASLRVNCLKHLAYSRIPPPPPPFYPQGLAPVGLCNGGDSNPLPHKRSPLPHTGAGPTRDYLRENGTGGGSCGRRGNALKGDL